MENQVESQLPAGTQIASYVIRRKIGSGGMGEVYLCDEPSLGRQVALKVLRTVDHDPEAASRFLQEGKAMAKLQHPNIVGVFGLGEHNGMLYIAMEYVQGLSLFTHSRDRKMSIPEMLNVFLDVARGLDYAHSAGLVHRDIKPANILVDHFGRGKLIDFGIAKAVGADVGAEGVKTKTGVVIGTLNYIAPELFRGDPPSPLSDIYALGLCFFEMLTGRTPFRSESQFQTMEKIRARDLEIPDNVHFMLPEEFWNVLYQMIAVEPLERTATATLAVERLRQVDLANIPKQWSAHIGTARIENLSELHSVLDAASIDIAERQFILSAALLRSGEKGEAAKDDVVDSTRLIETTGVVIPRSILEQALSEYQVERESLLTVRRAAKISELRVPEDVNTRLADGASVTPVAASSTQVVSPSTRPIATAPLQQAPSSSGGSKWAVALALAGVLAVGGLQYVRWQREDQARALALEAAKRAEAEVAKRKASRGERVLAPVSQGLAMVVEPSTDAWTPVEWANPTASGTSDWTWQVKSSLAPAEKVIRESRSLDLDDAENPGLYKIRIVTSQRDSGANRLIQRTAYEWYRPGYVGLPVKSSASPVLGTIGATILGEPERIFPLRKGKEVHFETELKSEGEQGLFPVFAELVGKPVLPGSLKLRASCVTGDQNAGQIVTDCTYRATNVAGKKIEIVSSAAWSLVAREIVAIRLRVVSTSDSSVEMHSISGQRAEVAVGLREPAQSAK